MNGYRIKPDYIKDGILDYLNLRRKEKFHIIDVYITYGYRDKLYHNFNIYEPQIKGVGGDNPCFN